MFEKLRAGLRVFQAGQAVADPALWKKRQITGGLVAGFLAALVAFARAFGYEIPLSDDALLQIGGAVVALLGLFNAGVTVASNDKLGLSAATVSAGPENRPSELSMPALPPQFDAAVPPVSDDRYACLAGLKSDYAA